MKIFNEELIKNICKKITKTDKYYLEFYNNLQFNGPGFEIHININSLDISIPMWYWPIDDTFSRDSNLTWDMIYEYMFIDYIDEGDLKDRLLDYYYEIGEVPEEVFEECAQCIKSICNSFKGIVESENININDLFIEDED